MHVPLSKSWFENGGGGARRGGLSEIFIVSRRVDCTGQGGPSSKSKICSLPPPPSPLSCPLALGLGGPLRRAGRQVEMKGRNWGEPREIQGGPWEETGKGGGWRCRGKTTGAEAAAAFGSGGTRSAEGCGRGAGAGRVAAPAGGR